MARKPIERDRLMLETRAARDYVDRAAGGDELLELEAFMSIFHPEFAEKKPMAMLELRQDARARRDQRKR